MLIFTPSVSEFIQMAKEKHGYDEEQALAMLFWHNHDLDLASKDLANFSPCPDQWTEEEKVLFEAAFKVHGKSFNRIRQMLPDKSIAALVQYYYLWKAGKMGGRKLCQVPGPSNVKLVEREDPEDGLSWKVWNFDPSYSEDFEIFIPDLESSLDPSQREQFKKDSAALQKI